MYKKSSYKNELFFAICKFTLFAVCAIILTTIFQGAHRMSLQQLTTVWGENITDKPLQEYPRPQFVRKSFVNLNGYWDYAITKNDVLPSVYDGKILVPFSPESPLSGVNRQLQPQEFLYYRTWFTLAKSFVKDIVLLNFGAVDCICDVYVNGQLVGRHEGGYTAFSVDVTSALKDTDNELIVRVRDFTDTKYYSNGKQSTRRGGMWYTPQSGIWQTVWLESVPAQYIQGLRITPSIDTASVTVEVTSNFDEPVTVIVYNGEKEIMKADGKNVVKLSFPNGICRLWSPEDPFLYGLKVISRRDIVESYFGMRKFSCAKVGKYYRLMLNNMPYFHNGLLDQGYWSDGLYTAPSDEAMIFDIQKMKDLGFNMLRKHIKVEPMRWYYHCDKEGILVWQDMPSGDMGNQWAPHTYNGGTDKERSSASIANYYQEWKEIMDLCVSHPSVVVWVPFNEAWGQFDTEKVAEWTKNYDPSRLVNPASGGNHRACGDILDLHNYPGPSMFLFDPQRVTVLGEYGGIGLPLENHLWWNKRNWGYVQFKNSDEVTAEYVKYANELKEMVDRGFSAAVYTQTTDVEGEVNGLMTYDRKEIKINEAAVKKANQAVINQLSK